MKNFPTSEIAKAIRSEADKKTRNTISRIDEFAERILFNASQRKNTAEYWVKYEHILCEIERTFRLEAKEVYDICVKNGFDVSVSEDMRTITVRW